MEMQSNNILARIFYKKSFNEPVSQLSLMNQLFARLEL